MTDRTPLRFIYRTLGRTRRGILALTVIQAVQGVCSICYALFLRNVINCAVAGDPRAFALATAKLAALFLSQLALAALRRYLDEATRSRLENQFKAQLFSQLMERDYSTVTAVSMTVRLAGAVVMIAVLEPRFLLLILPGGALLLATSTLFRKRMKSMHKRIRERDGALRSFLQETLNSMLVVRSYAVEAQTMETANRKMAQHRRARLARNRFSNLCNTGFGAVMQGASVAGALFCGYGILSGTMTYGDFTAVLNLIGQIQSPFANISGIIPRYYAVLASAERLMVIELYAEHTAEQLMPLEEVLPFYRDAFRGLLWPERCSRAIRSCCWTRRPAPWTRTQNAVCWPTSEA